MKTCATCALWQPERPISGIIRYGGRCKYKGETRFDYSCWGWTQCSPEQEESRRKAGLVDGEESKRFI